MEQTMPAIHRMCYCLASFPSIREYLYQEDLLMKEMAIHFSILVQKSHGQKSLEGYSPCGHKDSDVTEYAHMYQRVSCSGPHHNYMKKNYMKKVFSRCVIFATNETNMQAP